jgi:3-hydroxyisobutyrate dehydrogenase-like beta-hydroxyacid dehydrogenase
MQIGLIGAGQAAQSSARKAVDAGHNMSSAIVMGRTAAHRLQESLDHWHARGRFGMQ